MLMKTMKRKNTRLIVMLALAVALVLSMTTAAFAYDPGNSHTYDTYLYKTGTYPDDPEEHHGDGAFVGADYDDVTDTLTVYVQGVTIPPFTAYVDAITLDGVVGVGSDYVSGHPTVFIFTNFSLTTDTAYEADMSIVGHPGPDEASADLVFEVK
jgi:hypothetical protein